MKQFPDNLLLGSKAKLFGECFVLCLLVLMLSFLISCFLKDGVYNACGLTIKSS